MNKYIYVLTFNKHGSPNYETYFLKKSAVKRYIELVFIPSWEPEHGSISELKIYRNYYKRNGDLIREDYTQKLNKFLE